VPHVQLSRPSFGLKLLRDGVKSANILTLFSFDGQPSFNFFKNRLTTVVREPNNECDIFTVGRLFNRVSDHVGALSVLDVAKFDQWGNEEEDVNWPYQLDFEPYDVYGWTDEYQNDFQDQFTAIPINTLLYKVFAYDVPPEFGGEEQLIGWVVTRSEWISSLWGDTRLFFQHQAFDDALELREFYSDWLQEWQFGKFNEKEIKNPAPDVHCPFFFLFEKAGLV